jgi:hypothetical protein
MRVGAERASVKKNPPSLAGLFTMTFEISACNPAG